MPVDLDTSCHVCPYPTELIAVTALPPAPCIVDGAVFQVPAVACEDCTNPTTRNGTLVLPVVEYATLADVAPELIVVVVINDVSSRLTLPFMFATANSTVPALSKANTMIRCCCPLIVPKLAPDGTTKEIGEATVLVLTVPLLSVELRNVTVVEFKVTVNALVATDAVIGNIVGTEMLPAERTPVTLRSPVTLEFPVIVAAPEDNVPLVVILVGLKVPVIDTVPGKVTTCEASIEKAVAPAPVPVLKSNVPVASGVIDAPVVALPAFITVAISTPYATITKFDPSGTVIDAPSATIKDDATTPLYPEGITAFVVIVCAVKNIAPLSPP